MKTVILDAGHGIQTPGKRSPIWPDGSQLFEWEFNRDIVRRIAVGLDRLNIKYRILVPDNDDVPLSQRIGMINNDFDVRNRRAFVCSVHANAGGGTGWEVFTSPGQTLSDQIATAFFEEAKKEFSSDWRMRVDYTDGDPDKEARFAILTQTSCPAVLTENFFMDTERDCRFIMSEEGRSRVADVHIRAIKSIII